MENWQCELMQDNCTVSLMDNDFQAEEFVKNSILQNDSQQFNDLFQKINNLKQKVNQNFTQKVEQNYREIIDKIQNLNQMKLSNDPIADKISLMKQTSIQLNKNFVDHFQTLKIKTPQLQNAYKSVEICKHSLQFIQYVKILKSLYTANFEVLIFNAPQQLFNTIINNVLHFYFLKASQVIRDLEIVLAVSNLKSFPFYTQNKEFLEQAKNSIVDKSFKKFQTVLISKSLEETKNCLQIFSNLGNLSENIQNIANGLLKNSLNQWRNILTKDYDNQNKIYQEIKSQYNELFNQTTQIHMIKIALKTLDSNSFEPFENFIHQKNIKNIFELYWGKQMHIITQSFQKLQQNKDKFENNWNFIIRNYPKLLDHCNQFTINFNEFQILYPDDQKNDDEQMNNINQIDEPIQIMKEYYFQWLQQMNENLVNCILNNIIQKPQNVKQHLSSVFLEIQKFQQFFNIEFKENMQKNDQILQNASIIFLSSVEQIYKKIEMDQVEQISLSNCYIFLNICHVISKDILSSLLMNKKFNSDILILKTSIEKYLLMNQQLMEQFFGLYFKELYKSLSLIFEQNVKNTQCGAYEQITAIFGTINVFGYLNLFEKNLDFQQQWIEFIKIIGILLALIMSQFQDKTTEQIIFDMEFSTKLLEKYGGKNDLSKPFINYRKLFNMEVKATTRAIKQTPESLQQMYKYVVALHQLKNTPHFQFNCKTLGELLVILTENSLKIDLENPKSFYKQVSSIINIDFPKQYIKNHIQSQNQDLLQLLEALK